MERYKCDECEGYHDDADLQDIVLDAGKKTEQTKVICNGCFDAWMNKAASYDIDLRNYRDAMSRITDIANDLAETWNVEVTLQALRTLLSDNNLILQAISLGGAA